MNALTARLVHGAQHQTPPFNNLKARQAINFAFDRSAAVKLAGGSSLARADVPGPAAELPGYVQYCPYTANATADGAGAWTAPDYDKAKQLVQESGTAGTKVVVNTDGPDKPFGEQMVSDLNKIGYKASLVVLSGSIQYPFVQNSKNSDKCAGGWSAWYQDYPAPSDFLNVLLGVRIDPSQQRRQPEHRSVLRQGHSGEDRTRPCQTRVPEPEAANQLWAKVDHEVTDQAPWVDMYNPKQIDFLSKRCAGVPVEPAVVHPVRPALAQAVGAHEAGPSHQGRPRPDGKVIADG